jgi:hypothetical protein
MAGGGAAVADFYAYAPAFTGGVNVGVGDVNGDGVDDIVTGAGAGGPHVRAFSLAGGGPTEIAGFFAFDPMFTGGVSVAVGDVDGDGVDDIVTGAGTGGGRMCGCSVWRAVTRRKSPASFAYDPTFMGGVSIAVGDVNGDSVDEIAPARAPAPDRTCGRSA